MKTRLSRRVKHHLKRSYYALLDAVVCEKWLANGYLLAPGLVRRLRRRHFRRTPSHTLLYRRASGVVTLRLDGRAP